VSDSPLFDNLANHSATFPYNDLSKMHLTTTFLVLIGTVSALNVTSLVKSNSRIAVPAEFRRPNGAADIDLDELLSERITKRKAMTYCADQDSTDGVSRSP
jgi:hypothetical protein